MWKGYYGKEPFDLRLTALRLFYKLPAIALATLLGTLAFGGSYYVKHVLLRGQRTYAATSVYRVDYAVDNVEDMMNVFINEMSWNTYMQSQMFLDAVEDHLGPEADGEELEGMVRAAVLSDLRIPSTVVTSDSPEKSVAIARAVEEAMVHELAEEIGEIDSVTVIDPGDRAEEVLPDIRVGRAFVFGAALSCFLTVVVLLLKETGDDSIWLPASIWKRYGIKTAGTVESTGMAEHMRYFFLREKEGQQRQGGRVAVCPVQARLNPETVLRRLREACPDVVGEDWFAVRSPLQEPEACRQLREADGILLAVGAGRHAGRAMEQVLDCLWQQDCHVTAAILWDADEKLIRRYAFCGSGALRGTADGGKGQDEDSGACIGHE